MKIQRAKHNSSATPGVITLLLCPQCYHQLQHRRSQHSRAHHVSKLFILKVNRKLQNRRSYQHTHTTTTQKKTHGITKFHSKRFHLSITINKYTNKNYIPFSGSAEQKTKCTSCFSCCCLLLHIGESGHRLCERFGEHLRSVQKNTPGLPVAEHFNPAGHNLNDIFAEACDSVRAF